jgi:hypothetical protein
MVLQDRETGRDVRDHGGSRLPVRVILSGVVCEMELVEAFLDGFAPVFDPHDVARSPTT